VWREQGARIWRALLEFTSDPDVASDALAEAFSQAIARGDAIVDAERWVWRASFKIAGGYLKDRRAVLPLAAYPLEAEAHRSRHVEPHPLVDGLLPRLRPLLAPIHLRAQSAKIASVIGFPSAWR
jgi:hypothetical protein